jgi:L-aspartate oxidase
MRGEFRDAKAGVTQSTSEGNSKGNDSARLCEEQIQTIQNLMWQDVGIIRTGSGLRRAIQKLQEIQLVAPSSRRAWKAKNLHTAGLLVARSALAREESRGAHYRTDFPTHNDEKFLKHSIVIANDIFFA